MATVAVNHRRFPRFKAVEKDNQLLVATRILAALIVPVLLVAFLMLYFFPQHSKLLFAWGLKPSMSAMMLGAAYMGGAYYFMRVLVAKQWSRIKLGLIPVTSFASMLGIATLLHWDKFTPGHPSFIMWAFLYLTVPFVLPIIWWANQSADPHTLLAGDHYLPQPIERFFRVAGGILLVISLTLLILPDILISLWPWAMTPLSARVMAAMFALPCLVSLGVAHDKRWSSARVILQSQIFSIILILTALFIARGDLDWSQINAWGFAISMTAFCLILIGIYVRMERLRPA